MSVLLTKCRDSSKTSMIHAQNGSRQPMQEVQVVWSLYKTTHTYNRMGIEPLHLRLQDVPTNPTSRRIQAIGDFIHLHPLSIC